MSRIYTRRGDTGETGLYGGKRVSKAALSVETYGTIDELNSVIGLLISFREYTPYREELFAIQNDLFILGSYLASTPEKRIGFKGISKDKVLFLEKLIDETDKNLPVLKSFVLPGGNTASAYCHMARTICRRAERHAVAMHEHEPLNSEVLEYLNRLSDYLFVLARAVLIRNGGKEIEWKPEK